MKLVLASSNISQKNILEEVLNLVGKSAKEVSVAILNEASSVEEGDKRWLIEGLDILSKTFGGTIELVNLLALDITQIEKRIEKYDIIFCFGGSTEWLKVVFEKTGFSKLLPKLLKNKVWIGSSAGSMILGRMPTTITQDYIYNVENYYGITDYLKIVNLSILPHVFGEFVPKDSFEKCIEESKKQQYPVYVLSDKSAVIVNDEKVYMVGEQCYKLQAGEIIEKL